MTNYDSLDPNVTLETGEMPLVIAESIQRYFSYEVIDFSKELLLTSNPSKLIDEYIIQGVDFILRHNSLVNEIQTAELMLPFAYSIFITCLNKSNHDVIFEPVAGIPGSGKSTFLKDLESVIRLGTNGIFIPNDGSEYSNLFSKFVPLRKRLREISVPIDDHIASLFSIWMATKRVIEGKCIIAFDTWPSSKVQFKHYNRLETLVSQESRQKLSLLPTLIVLLPPFKVEDIKASHTQAVLAIGEVVKLVESQIGNNEVIASKRIQRLIDNLGNQNEFVKLYLEESKQSCLRIESDQKRSNREDTNPNELLKRIIWFYTQVCPAFLEQPNCKLVSKV